MSQTFPSYEEAKAYAIQQVRECQFAYGIEKAGALDPKGSYRVFMLPRPENRFGHELRCEPVEPSDYPPVKKLAHGP